MTRQNTFDTMQFLRDRRIPHTTDHHHCSDGWVVMHCPLCPPGASKNYHIGVELSTGRVNCWRCGGHNLPSLVRGLLGCDWSEAFREMEKYGGVPLRRAEGEKYEAAHPTVLTLPVGTGPLKDRHKRYLLDRGFAPMELAVKWGLFGTGHLGPYKQRIIIPMLVEGVPVSYTGRDVTGRATLRYKDCPLAEEVAPLKHCLYGLDKVPGKAVVVVEGAVDVWRLGAGAVATMGIQWNYHHVNALAEFDYVGVLYDDQPQAQVQATKLVEELSYLVPHTEVLHRRGGDPGDLSPREADLIMRQLMKRGKFIL